MRINLCVLKVKCKCKLLCKHRKTKKFQMALNDKKRKKEFYEYIKRFKL